MRVAIGAITNDRDAAIDDGNVGQERGRAASVVNPGMRENRLYQRLA
jgi:hypothetical protein